MSATRTEKTVELRDVSKPLSRNTHLLNWVEKMALLTKPNAIHWVDGSLEEAARASGTHESAEHGASAQSSAPEHTTDRPHSLQDSSDYDDEPSPASRFPQPKFPQEAIEALSALDFGLPPRQEAPSPSNVQPTLPAASATERPSPTESTEHNETTPVAETPIAAAPVTPVTVSYSDSILSDPERFYRLRVTGSVR